jgi:hypothetical protein
MNQTFRGGLALYRLVEDGPIDLLPDFLGLQSVVPSDEEAQLRAALVCPLESGPP